MLKTRAKTRPLTRIKTGLPKGLQSPPKRGALGRILLYAKSDQALVRRFIATSYAPQFKNTQSCHSLHRIRFTILDAFFERYLNTEYVMLERVVVLQSDRFETFFWAPDPGHPESDAFRPVDQLDLLTPHGMLLASLGSCTARVLHTHAQIHGMILKHVELRLQYGTPPPDEAVDRGGNGKHTAKIEEEIVLYGRLSPEEHDTLLRVVDQSSIFRILQDGTEVCSLRAEA
jgi:uncharacterized OsmC-like protein